MKTTKSIMWAILLGIATATVVPPASAQMTGMEQRKQAKKDKREGREQKAEPEYPQTLRVEPKRGPTKIVGPMKKLVDAYEEKLDPDRQIALAEAVMENPKANAYERSIAAQIAATAWQEKEVENSDNAIRYMQRALLENGLDNNGHFNLMLQLAQTQIADDKNDEGLKTLGAFLLESKSTRPEAFVLQGRAYYSTDRFQEAINAIKQAIANSPNPDKNWNQILMASYFELDQPQEAVKIAEQIVAASPDDKASQLNLANIYMRIDQYEKAGAVFDRLRAAGKLTEAREYESAYKLMANIEGREKDAIALINEGLAKNILKPTFDVYNVLGQSYYFSEQIPEAVAAWGKAAPLDKDGETYLKLATILSQEENGAAEAKNNARQALARGVKRPGDAWMVIARAEYDLENRAAMAAAYREAAKYPETRDKAARALKQMGAK